MCAQNFVVNQNNSNHKQDYQHEKKYQALKICAKFLQIYQMMVTWYILLAHTHTPDHLYG